MNIVVLIKQVPSTTNARMDPKTGVMLRDASDTVLNPLDENAITEAVKIKQMHPGSTVTVLTMGPESAQKVLFEACARGADKSNRPNRQNRRPQDIYWRRGIRQNPTPGRDDYI